jgi:hypothetical protein
MRRFLIAFILAAAALAVMATAVGADTMGSCC